IINPLTDEILESREMIMHNLLSLPEGDEVFSRFESSATTFDKTGHRRSLHLYELCRWSSLLFGVMVIFPIPRSKWAREYTLSKVRVEMSTLPVKRENPETTKALMWCAMLAGSLSYVEEEYLWFRERVHEAQDSLRIKTWEEA